MAIQDHNLNISEENYRGLDIPSYSMLSSISQQGVDVVHGIKTSMNFKFGSLVDMMCFEPHRVDDTFYKGASVKPPTTNVKNICDLILQNIDKPIGHIAKGVSAIGRRKQKKITNELSDYRKEILASALRLKIYKTYSDDKTFDTVVNAGQEYFKDRLTSRGKTLIKPEMWKLASITAATLITHPYTSKYFAKNVPGVEIIYQYKFDTKVNGHRCKGMLDCLIVNHDAKVIIPVDLKTGEAPCKDFPKLYTSHRYYLQGALYKEAIKSIVDIDFDLSGYQVNNFQFIYISKLNPGKPMVFHTRKSMHDLALSGFTDRHGDKYEGVYELLEKYYYAKNNNSDYDESEVSTNGVMIIDAKSITGS